jgi:hypothetical protein
MSNGCIIGSSNRYQAREKCMAKDRGKKEIKKPKQTKVK